MRHKFEIEFEYDLNTYLTRGYVDIWSENVIGTTFGDETEILVDTGISHIEIDELILITDDGGADVMNQKEIKDIAIEIISDKYN